MHNPAMGQRWSIEAIDEYGKAWDQERVDSMNIAHLKASHRSKWARIRVTGSGYYGKPIVLWYLDGRQLTAR